MRKIIIILLLLLILPFLVFARSDAEEDVIFKAEIIEILAEKESVLSDGRVDLQQHLKMLGLEGDFKDKEFEFNGIGDINVLNKQIYEIGDKVLVIENKAEDKSNYYIVDYARLGTLLWLAALFVLVLLFVGKIKGLRSLLSLFLSFVIIIKFIIPRIITGANPLLITILGSIAILLVIIYLTEGLKPKAHLAFASIFASLLLTIIISQIFVNLAKLTGAASEDILFLFNIGGLSINLQGLLLAGIIIGALGVLDDVVIAQISTVKEIALADRELNSKTVFSKAYKVGISHIASMTNTLFLAYAGVSLPLLILFVSGESAFVSWTQALNTELIATEIIRALTGSISLILSVPISTYIASRWYCGRKRVLK
ncbi:MAG: YibE/F family protein [Patescibacteria group bacterium]|nr:YibE/F family protein [Patescibacteria group bacterium]